jgi:hypothetical protein
MWPFKNRKKQDEETQQITDFLEEARKMKDDIESAPDEPALRIPQISFIQAEAGIRNRQVQDEKQPGGGTIQQRRCIESDAHRAASSR